MVKTQIEVSWYLKGGNLKTQTTKLPIPLGTADLPSLMLSLLPIRIVSLMSMHDEHA